MSGPTIPIIVRRVAPLAAAAALGALVAWVALTAPTAQLGTPTAPSGSTAGEVRPVECPTSLQPLIDAAAPGDAFSLPACIARETLQVDKPVTLVGVAGGEIRGSDVWTDWYPDGGTWTSALGVPPLAAHGSCRRGTDRCLLPEQVFIDGVAQLQLAAGSRPGAGEFALDSNRHVMLGQDPAGHLVEVTVRTRWIVPTIDGITVVGLRMRHAANDAQEGAITDDGHAVTIIDCVMSDTHGAVISMTGPGSLIGNDIFRGGQLGVHKGGRIIQGNRIHDNNTEDFSWGWESGGVKSVLGDQLVVGNEVFDNNGPGLWWDGAASNVRLLGNRVHDNAAAGIIYEIGTGGQIVGNAVWRNGDEDAEWGWGAGILVSSSAAVQVNDNIVAWNADGISVISQQRDDAPAEIANIRVERNIIVGTDRRPLPGQNYGLAWLEDWPGRLFDPASANGGDDNAFWYGTLEGPTRFAWDGDLAALSAFATKPGGATSRYLSDVDKEAILAHAGLPPAP